MTRPDEFPNAQRSSGPVIFVNVFEIDAEQLDLFLAQWRERAEFMSRQPGFRSFRLHRALSPEARFQLINVAEWDSADALSAATRQPYFQQSMRRSAAELSVVAHPGLYDVAFEIGAPPPHTHPGSGERSAPATH